MKDYLQTYKRPSGLSHKTMREPTAEVKRKFMLSEKNGNIIVNIDDKVGESIFKNSVLPDKKK